MSKINKENEVLFNCLRDVRKEILDYLYEEHPEVKNIVQMILKSYLKNCDQKHAVEVVIFELYKKINKID